MKKLVALAGMLAAFTQSSIILASDRPATTNPQGPRSLWRTLFSCCCTDATADIAEGVIEAVHMGLEVILAANPGAVREIYLVCQRAEYALSDFTLDLLNRNGFLDERGDFKPGWKNHIKELLTHNGAPAGKEGFHLVQCIQDLVNKHPDAVADLEGAVAGKNKYLDATARLLNEQYGLTQSPQTITPDELARIAEQIQKERAGTSVPATRAHGHERKAPDFRIMEIGEATLGKHSDLFA